jgi:zinc transporter
MSRLLTEEVSWIGPRDRVRLREVTDRVTRHVEDLDSIRNRAAVTHEELASRLAQQTNRTMYMLSIVAAIFLPLGLLTGLLGINVGGMPGTDTPWAFWIVCAFLGVITVVEVIILSRTKWL